MRDLAARLLADEKSGSYASSSGTGAAIRICKVLQSSITKFAGADGYSALMRRALALSRVESPALQAAAVNSEGKIEGLETALAGEPDQGTETAIILIGNMLALLVILIGEPLTLRLVANAELDRRSDSDQQEGSKFYGSK